MVSSVQELQDYLHTNANVDPSLLAKLNELSDSSLPFVGLQIRGGASPVTDVTALLDTGARQTMMNRAAAEALGINLPPAPAPGQEDLIEGASGHSMQGIMLMVGRIAVGEREWRNTRGSVADLHVFDVLERSDQPTMILASDLLLEGRLVVSYADAEVLIELPN